MSGVFNKMSNLFFDNDEDDEEVVETSQGETLDIPGNNNVWQEPDLKKSKKNQMVSIPSSHSPKKAMEMVLVKAKSYDEIQVIGRHIKNRKAVIVNFEDMDRETSQRMIDFLSGAAFALDGAPSKVSGGTFLFSPNQVGLEGQIMEGEGSAAAVSDNPAYNIWKQQQ